MALKVQYNFDLPTVTNVLVHGRFAIFPATVRMCLSEEDQPDAVPVIYSFCQDLYGCLGNHSPK